MMKIEKGIFLVYVVCMILPLLTGCNRGNKKTTIILDQVSVYKNSLEIFYEINNLTSERLWFCDDIDIKLPANEIAYIQGDTINIERRLSSLPKEMEFNPSIVARYILIKPGEKRRFSVTISISDNFWSFVKYEDYPPSFDDIKKIHLSIGYIDSNLSKEYLTSDDTTIYGRELPQFIKKMHIDRLCPEVLYVLNTWSPIYTEKTIDTLITCSK